MLCIWFTHIILFTHAQHIKVTTKHVNSVKQKVYIHFPLSKNDFIYKDFISFSAAHPLFHCSPWKTKSTSIPYYDPLFKETKEIFNNNVTIGTTITIEEPTDDQVYVYCTYYQRSEKKIKQLPIQLTFLNNTHIHTAHQSIHTHLETSGQQEKTYSIPFNVYLFRLFYNIKQLIVGMNITPAIHGFMIIFLLLLYFFTLYSLKKNTRYTIEHKIMLFFAYFSLFFLLVYILCLIDTYLSSYIAIPLMSLLCFCGGIFYLKKSTSIPSECLRALCTLYGGLLLITSIPFLFKVIQLFDIYYIQ